MTSFQSDGLICILLHFLYFIFGKSTMSLYNVYVTKNKYNMKDNPCVRFAYFGSDGEPVYKNKKAFDTDKEAIAYAKEMNKRNIDKIIRKLVAYKCDKCHKWHVGRSYATLSEKEREKIKND